MPVNPYSRLILSVTNTEPSQSEILTVDLYDQSRYIRDIIHLPCQNASIRHRPQGQHVDLRQNVSTLKPNHSLGFAAGSGTGRNDQATPNVHSYSGRPSIRSTHEEHVQHDDRTWQVAWLIVALNVNANMSLPSTGGSSSNLTTPQANQHPHSPGAGMSRAERYESERTRLVASCFSKYEPNGQLSEAYVTHLSIIEDAQYPQTPPPPDSAADNKKPRLIVIAVRSTGRVRMHKARENSNGSFSIGKTWNMEELSAIESYSTSAPAQSDREAQDRAWAGSLGFTVTITKPYYWQAKTSKEKDFFIASAIKIYRKYTRGQIPEMKGFDQGEMATLLGAAPGQSLPPNGSRAQSESRQSPAPPQPPFARRPQSRDDSRYRQSPGPPPGSGPTSRQTSESPARFGTSGPPGPPGPRSYMSNDQLRGANLDGGRQEYRPGTSPGPLPGQGYRVPSLPQSQRSGVHSPVSPLRSDSPATRGRDYTPPAPAMLFQSPPRPVNGPRATEGVSMNRQADASRGSNGTDMRTNSRPPSGPRYPEQKREQSRSSAPQIPALQTYSSPQNGHVQDAGEVGPQTATSESSAGVDLGDAAVVGALTSYWGPEPTPAATPPTGSQEALSPLTPERSKKRPPFAANASETSMDLRPAPLNQSRKGTRDGFDRAVPPSDISGEVTPRQEESPEIRPLQIHAKSDTQLPLANASTHSQVSPPPASTPGETPSADKEEVDTKDEEEFRPGLGPMIKKKAIADRFKKAATAANAFKPRPGGAAEKILKARAEREGGPDGITGVVPRPAAREVPLESTDAAVPEDLSVKPPTRDVPPTVEVSSPQSAVHEQPMMEAAFAMDHSQGTELVDDISHLQPPPQEEETIETEQVEEPRMRKPPNKIRRRSVQQEKYLAEIGIDRSLLEGRGLEFEMMLSDFGWNADILQPKRLAALESDIRREQGRIEAGSWLSHTDAAREERVTHVENLLDRAIAECDELEGLLTLYKVELSSLNDDIAFIEAQSQGLQVQSANQKLLQTELRGLVDTMSLDRRVMEPLKHGDLSSPNSVEDVEKSLIRLYQAILTMDPSARTTGPGRPRSRGGLGDNQASTMVALREKKIDYDRQSAEFCQRLMQYLDSKFTTCMNGAKGRVVRVPNNGGLAKLHTDAFDDARNGLWMYSPLILYTKEINLPAWQTLLRMYHTQAKPLYVDAFKQNISNWKRAARAPSGDEMDILFTAQEKEDAAAGSGGLSSTARKLTVKRSHTLAKSLRNAGEKSGSADARQPGALMRSVAFAGAMDEMAPLMSREQNFIVDLFHATTLETTDFIDAVTAASPGRRHGTNLIERRPAEPDREMVRRVGSVMSDIFGFFTDEFSALLDWSISEDPLQGVGVMANLSRHAYYLHEGSQEYLLLTIENLSARLQGRFAKFVEEQVRAIEDTKVKIKKRKGVIAFMKIFPLFSAAVENVFSAVAGNDYQAPSDCVLDVRKLIDNAYEKINRAMFDSLKVIAKESPSAGMAQGQQARSGDDFEDKEMLNYHVLLIENMNHYVEDVDDGGKPGVLADWKGRALMERSEALDAYISRVIRRPLGKVLVSLNSLRRYLFGQSLLTHSRRTFSKPPNPSNHPITIIRAHYPRGLHTPAKSFAPFCPSTTVKKSDGVSILSASASRNISARPTKKLFRATWSDSCARSANGAMIASTTGWKVSCAKPIRRRRVRSRWKSSSPRRTFSQASDDEGHLNPVAAVSASPAFHLACPVGYPSVLRVSNLFPVRALVYMLFSVAGAFSSRWSYLPFDSFDI